MLKFGDDKGQLKCSFCGKTQEQVKKLVAGPGVYICDECIELCNEIIEEELNENITGSSSGRPAWEHPPCTGRNSTEHVSMCKVS